MFFFVSVSQSVHAEKHPKLQKPCFFVLFLSATTVQMSPTHCFSSVALNSL